jgi:hypothetical protein
MVYTVIRWHLDALRMVHGARVEGRDLIGVEVGRDEGLGAVFPFDDRQVLRGDAGLRHPIAIGLEVRTDSPHGIAGFAQQLEVVGDIARTAAKLAPHLRDEKGHVQHVELVREDVLPETVRKHHDGVVCDRSADECALLVLTRHAPPQLLMTNPLSAESSSKAPSMTARNQRAVSSTPPNAKKWGAKIRESGVACLAR